jgi:hypothetical protein
MTFILVSSGEVMIDPLSLNDFSEVEVGRTLSINVHSSENGTFQPSSTDTPYGSKTSSEQRK